MADGRRFKNI